MAKVRVRQHVNPLSHKYRHPIAPPDWNQVYQDMTQPLHLDIGCARGKFLLQMAQVEPEINFLGIEIRQPLVIEANQERERLGLSNLSVYSPHSATRCRGGYTSSHTEKKHTSETRERTNC